MKNVTITLDEDVARWARVEAAKVGKSLSRWIGERLAETRAEDPQPDDLLKWLEGAGWPSSAGPLPKRDEIGRLGTVYQPSRLSPGSTRGQQNDR